MAASTPTTSFLSALADSLGVPQSPAVRWAVAVGVPAAVWYLLSGWGRGGYDDDRTDFDGFLKRVEPVGSTGAAPAAAAARTSGSIDRFFRDAGQAAAEEEDSRNPVDFDSFLKKPRKAAAAAAAAPAAKPPAPPAERPRPEQAQVLVMFGTEYGFSKEVAEKLCSQLKATGKYWPVLRNMADCPDGHDFSKEQAVFMACSTQGDGVPPTEARDFCEWLFAAKAGGLAHLKFSICALGDKSYTHFSRCGKLLDAALEKAGAVRLAERVDVNKEDWPVVDAWLAAVLAALAQQTLQTIGSLGGLPGDGEQASAKQPAAKKWGRSRPYTATMVALEPLCTLSAQDDKNTVRAEFDLGGSGMTYLPGDALGIYPLNGPEYVAELISMMGASPSELVPVPSWHYEEQGASYEGGRMELAQALAKCYDIRSPKPDLLKLLLAALQGAPAANGHANGHANGNGTHEGPEAGPSPAEVLSQVLGDAAATEAYLAKRHVVDVLGEFAAAAATLTTAQVLGSLRQLQARLYSISSSPLEGAARVQVTVAEVKYQTLGKGRVGVCSTYLSERLQVGARVPIYVHRNPDFRLPASPSTPIIMVGPGTGLAPFRSFILERLLQARAAAGASAAEAPGQMVLYFGCRRPDQDYLYGPVLEGWAAEGALTLFTAFSRQPQTPKVYVQQRLAESGDLVWSLLQAGGHFYVCGDASSMAGAVEEALLAIIGAKLGGEGEGEGAGAGGRAAAEEYLKAMSEAQRYQRDVWY